jgi:hypothetical protein
VAGSFKAAKHVNGCLANSDALVMTRCLLLQPRAFDLLDKNSQSRAASDRDTRLQRSIQRELTAAGYEDGLSLLENCEALVKTKNVVSAVSIHWGVLDGGIATPPVRSGPPFRIRRWSTDRCLDGGF